MTIEQIYAELAQEVTIEENDENLQQKLEAARYRYNDKIIDIDYRLKVEVENETFDIAGLGMIGIVTGQQKSRKTTFLKALVAGAISGKQFLNFTFNLPEGKIYFFDTEQPVAYFRKTQRQILHMAGLTLDCDRYFAYMMRDWTVEERNIAVEEVIGKNNDIGLIVIDGSLDMISNFNDEVECKEYVQRLMRWTVQSGAMIITVIHQNKGTKFMMGHIGSMISKKCDFGFEMKQSQNSTTTTINASDTRTKPFPSFEFMQDEYGYPVLNQKQTKVKPQVQSISTLKVKENYPSYWDF